MGGLLSSTFSSLMVLVLHVCWFVCPTRLQGTPGRRHRITSEHLISMAQNCLVSSRCSKLSKAQASPAMSTNLSTPNLTGHNIQILEDRACFPLKHTCHPSRAQSHLLALCCGPRMGRFCPQSSGWGGLRSRLPRITEQQRQSLGFPVGPGCRPLALLALWHRPTALTS